ncbi:hypothetical protein O6P43_013671 [Quillaja saponaria]|uniref:Uncharacterized protein n=1 Tax=Quillaja saponaria TaxID=32244 RepID=A0AAD7LSZ3_QUISA|nr:hypothetical protein O6P43_013671 [Quillaja saponaria]
MGLAEGIVSGNIERAGGGRDNPADISSNSTSALASPLSEHSVKSEEFVADYEALEGSTTMDSYPSTLRNTHPQFLVDSLRAVVADYLNSNKYRASFAEEALTYYDDKYVAYKDDLVKIELDFPVECLKLPLPSEADDTGNEPSQQAIEKLPTENVMVGSHPEEDRVGN